jgi:glycosyltransferase involved in cell wall biosynthesis
MRIAMLHPSLTWHGGAERQILNLAIELQRAGHVVEIFTCALNDTFYTEQVKHLTINVVQAPTVQTTQSVNQKRTITRRLAGRFRNYTTDLPSMLYLGKKIPAGFDVINNHNAPTEWAAFFAKRKLNAPIVWMCNEPPFWFSDPKQRKGLGKINLPLYEGLDKVAVDYIDSIVSVSLIDSRRIQKAYGRLSEIVRPGININPFHKASGKEVRLKYGLENDFVLLQVGNIARDKRQSDSIIALHYLSKKHYNITLILVGQGPKEELIALSRKLGVEKKVLFLQVCSDEELAQVYAACDVFVFPAEITWGLVVIEAMAASKTVLVSRQSGSSEVIHSGQNGIIIDEPYGKNMAAEIEKLIPDSDLRHTMGINAYEYTRENLSWEVYARNMETVFKKTIKSFRKNK